ncbi:MAG: AEC family transporter [Clostridia bacterium]|jgi:predicted permease|nr:AEC family transporter [Clostridia bacterium]MCI2000450.1 AEC family transporter [Clostridia bacterium]MCI2014905.1 AEC family transporter [Clostridia bacterium]
MYSLTVINSMVVIFTLAVPGFVFRKLGLADEHQLKTMSSFMMNIILPAIIIQSMQINFSKEILISGAKIFLAVFIMFFVVLGFSVVFSKSASIGTKNTGLVAFMLFFANTGGIGIPVMKMLFGNEAVFYASSVEIAVDILIFTGGILLMQSSSENKKVNFNIRALISPGTFGIVCGLILFVTGIRLPDILNNVFNHLSEASLAVTMFVIGAQIGAVKFKKMLYEKRMYYVTAAKLIVIPVIMFAITYFLRCSFMPSLVLTVLFAMPTGGAAVIFANEYGTDDIFAAEVVFLTDVCSLFTIPVLMILINSIT